MKIALAKEIKDGEYRVGMIPSNVARLVDAGHTVYVQKDAGTAAGYPDTAICILYSTKQSVIFIFSISRISAFYIYTAYCMTTAIKSLSIWLNIISFNGTLHCYRYPRSEFFKFRRNIVFSESNVLNHNILCENSIFLNTVVNLLSKPVKLTCI